MQNIDTVEQTAWVRFFLDLYWYDPAFIGATSVPEFAWRPEGSFVENQHGQLDTLVLSDRPILFDASVGLLLWPVEYFGHIKNPLVLRAFLFDMDALDLRITQRETTSRDEL